MQIAKSCAKAIARQIAIPDENNRSALPTFSALSSGTITDTGATVAGTVNPGGASTVWSIEYGETTAYGSTATGGTITEETAISKALTGLTPYTLYHWRIKAVNSAGTAYSADQTLTTLIPAELSDGNWLGMFEYNHASNQYVSTDRVAQLRDIRLNNAEGPELYVNGGFDVDSDWTKGDGWSITGGNAVGSPGAESYLTQSVGTLNGIFNSTINVSSITGSYVTFRNLRSAPVITSPGVTTFNNAICSSATQGITKVALTNCQINSISLRRILGNHFVAFDTAARPVKSENYIECNGTTHYMLSANTGATSLGTVYAIVQRVGTDAEFVALNSITGIGAIVSGALHLGWNGAGTYYNVRIKALYIRSQGTTDSASVIDKINNYLKKKFDLVIFANEHGAMPDGVTNNADTLQTLINNNAGKEIIVGNSRADVYIINNPINIISNTKLTINGTIKLCEGSVRPLLADCLVGQPVVPVANAPLYFKVGQRVSVSSDIMRGGGGGSNARPRHRQGQSSKIISVQDNSITLQDTLKGTYDWTATITGFYLSDNAKVGHTQSIFVIEQKSNVTIQGSGLLDGSLPSQYDVMPVVIDPAISYSEDQRAGNGIFVYQSNNINVSIAVKDTTLHGICFDDVDDYTITDTVVDGATDKGVIIMYTTNGVLSNIEAKNSLNEDGLTIYSSNDGIVLNNIVCSNNPRSGVGIATNNKNITFNGVTLDNNRLGLYINTPTSNIANNTITFNDVSIVGGVAPLFLLNSKNLVFNNLQISRATSDTCILINNMVDNVQFNGGGCYDTIGYSTGTGTGFWFEASSGSNADAKNITWTNFEFRRLKSFCRIYETGITNIVLDTCTIGNNTNNNFVTNELLTKVNCNIY